jgi:hypothetical protein
LASIVAAGLMAAAPVPQVKSMIPEIALARMVRGINVVLYLSPCTPCSSTVISELADFVRGNNRAHVTIVANQFVPRGIDVVAPVFGRNPLVSFVVDSDGAITRAAGVSMTPYIVAFDEKQRVLRTEVISPIPAAHTHLKEELEALYALQNH